MEERKRPASNEDGDAAPPLKRQATSKEAKPAKGQESDMPGRDDLEKFKKEAIYRQLVEYKREKQTLENRLKELEKNSAFHDEHIHTIDAALDQLVDEIRLSVTNSLPSHSYTPLSSQLLNSDIETFKMHLETRSQAISAAIKSIAAHDGEMQTELSELQAQLIKRLALEKDHLNELDSLRQERENLVKRLETATSRYMMAEKKLDRAKSATVAKLEAQAIASSRPETSSPVEGPGNSDQSNGVAVDSEALSRAEEARNQAEAASLKQKEQLDLIAAENDKLTAQLTASKSKPTILTDEDYAKTDLFKQLKLQHEDVIKRVNDLEATNIELRKEAERLHAERTAFRSQFEAEHTGPLNDKDIQIGRLEADLARVRTQRDDFQVKIQQVEATEQQENSSTTQLKNFVEAKDERIRSLEAEIERISLSHAEVDSEEGSPDELRTKFANLQKQYKMLTEELQGAGMAYKKLQASVNAKITGQAELEDRIRRANVDKGKADQKFFAAMKAKDTLRMEVTTLRAQASKSSDLIAQLREAEQSSKTLVTNLESEIAKTKELLQQTTKQNSKAQAELAEHVAGTSGLRSQMDDLRSQLQAKDATIADVRNARRKAEIEVEELRVSVRERDKKIEAAKKKGGAASPNDELERMREILICTVCRANFKDTVITTCGHTMCEGCVQERITSRSRKCPHCAKPFGANDHMKLAFT